MTAPTTPSVPTARQRPTKTRSKTQRFSSRPALALSTLRLTSIDLTSGLEHLVCPDCETWCPITGIRSTPRLVPHHTEPAGTPDPRRCVGSNRRIVLDVTVDRWYRRHVEGDADTASRRPRATRVMPRPKPPAPPALIHLRRPAPAESGPRAARRRAAEWAAVLPAVRRADAERATVPTA